MDRVQDESSPRQSFWWGVGEDDPNRPISPNSLLDEHGPRLTDECLHTLLLEAEAIVNSRPLTCLDMSSDSPEPLSPVQLLTMKSRVVLPPPGRFVKEDMYCRKRWLRVQFLANEFWARWRREFLPTLQERRKWTTPKDNLRKGDIVLLLDESAPRCQWPKGVIAETFPSEDGFVCKVKVRTATSEYERPIHKMILLLRMEIPVKEPTVIHEL